VHIYLSHVHRLYVTCPWSFLTLRHVNRDRFYYIYNCPALLYMYMRSRSIIHGGVHSSQPRLLRSRPPTYTNAVHWPHGNRAFSVGRSRGVDVHRCSNTTSVPTVSSIRTQFPIRTSLRMMNAPLSSIHYRNPTSRMEWQRASDCVLRGWH